MQESELKAIEGLRAASTDGEWHISEGAEDEYSATICVEGNMIIDSRYLRNRQYGIENGPDAEYIVAACNATPQLIAHIREQDEKFKEMEKEIERLDKANNDQAALLESAADQFDTIAEQAKEIERLNTILEKVYDDVVDD